MKLMTLIIIEDQYDIADKCRTDVTLNICLRDLIEDLQPNRKKKIYRTTTVRKMHKIAREKSAHL